jgi:hypothetical protein
MARPLALTEQAFIDYIAQRARPIRPKPVVGIGDDTAVLNLPPRSQTLLTTDLLTDGVHFRAERTTISRPWAASRTPVSLPSDSPAARPSRTPAESLAAWSTWPAPTRWRWSVVTPAPRGRCS